MEAIENVITVLGFIGILLIPFLKRFIAFQFISLVAVAFIIGWLFDDIFKSTGMDIQSIVLLLLLFGGLIYNSIRFYKKHVA